MLELDRHANLPLIPPQFGHPGPYSPGMIVPVQLPVFNLRGESEHDVAVQFYAHGADLNPAHVMIDSISGHGHATVTTQATIRHHEDEMVTVWADISLPQRDPLTTARVTASISAHARLVVSARTEHGTTSIRVRNEGHAPAYVCLAGVGRALADTVSDGISWTLDNAQLVSDAFELQPDQEKTLSVANELAAVHARTTTGERAYSVVSNGTSLVPTLDTPQLDIQYPETGLRNGDVVSMYLHLRNPSGQPVHHVRLALQLPDSLELLTDSLAIDDVRILPSDIVRGAKSTVIVVGRLDADHTTTLRGVLISHTDRNDPREMLPVRGQLVGSNLASYELGVDLPIDRRPAFATTQTYLSELREDDNGTYALDAAITNAESASIERVRIRWNLHGLLPISASDDKGNAIILQPGSYDGRPCLITDLHTLEPHERRIVTLTLEPTLTFEQERDIAAAASLLVDTTSIALGQSRQTINCTPDLSDSGLSCKETTLQSGIPRRVTIKIANNGASAANDVRLALELPEGVYTEGLRDPEPGSRWAHIAPILPPGSSFSTTFLLGLHDHPRGERVIIRASLDASNGSPIDLEPLALATPSAPMLQQPEITLEPLDYGMLRVRARIVNMGDGPAMSVLLKVPPDDHGDIVAGSTTIDGNAQDDRSVRSALLVGLPIGTLPAGSFRLVEWTVAPDANRPYRATLTVDARTAQDDPLATITAQSAPRQPRPFARLATALPEARRLADDQEVRAPQRATRWVEPSPSTPLSDVTHTALPSSEPTPGSTAAANGAAANGHSNGFATVTDTGEAQSTEDDSAQGDDTIDSVAQAIPPSTELTPVQESGDVARVNDVELGVLNPSERQGTTIGLTMLRELMDSGDCGVLAHVLGSHFLVADHLEGNDTAKAALQEIHDAIDALAQKLMQFIYAGRPDTRWLAQLDAYDEQVVDATARYIEAVFSPEDALPPEGLGDIDASLTLLHATRIYGCGPSTHDALQAYSLALASNLRNAWNTPQERNERVLSTTNETLDAALRRFLDALPAD